MKSKGGKKKEKGQNSQFIIPKEEQKKNLHEKVVNRFGESGPSMPHNHKWTKMWCHWRHFKNKRTELWSSSAAWSRKMMHFSAHFEAYRISIFNTNVERSLKISYWHFWRGFYTLRGITYHLRIQDKINREKNKKSRARIWNQNWRQEKNLEQDSSPLLHLN